jgi:hypothetical protein
MMIFRWKMHLINSLCSQYINTHYQVLWTPAYTVHLKNFPDWMLYGSTSSAICQTTSEVVSTTLHESRDQFSTVEVRSFMIERFEHAYVLWCCVTISTWSKELQSNFVSNWVTVLPKLMNCYKKHMEVILCLVQRHLNDLNNFETYQGQHEEITCENNVHQLLQRSRRD